MSEVEEETNNDDQLPADSLEVTSSEFFHKNRFEALQSDTTHEPSYSGDGNRGDDDNIGADNSDNNNINGGYESNKEVA